MPLYDFTCERCGADFEAFAPPGGTPDACPQCAAADVRRRYSAPATLRIGLRGAEARKSDAKRAAREQRRQEGFAAKRERGGD